MVGSTGSSAVLVNGEVTNSLTIWASPGIDLIESGAARSLSCGYAYTPVMQSGSFQGRPYEIVMTDIKPNHLALVAEPRVAGAMVGDAMPRARIKRSMDMADNDDNDTDAALGKILEFLETIVSPDDLEIVQSLYCGAADVDEARETQAVARRDDDRRSGRQAADSARRRGMSGSTEDIYPRMFPHSRSAGVMSAALKRASEPTPFPSAQRAALAHAIARAADAGARRVALEQAAASS